jgi:endonuclease YncB( thermonuclease family)/dienelactone hydrolase
MAISSRLPSLLAGLALLTAVLPAVAQEQAMVPVTIDGETLKIATTTYKPAGAGPFPTLIFHHGSTGNGRDPARFVGSYDPKALARWFTDRGWAVILPSRRGRSGSEGTYDEGFEPDRAQGYSCEPKLALAGAERALRDLDAITPVLLAQPFVDRERVAIGGHSRGGALAIAWSGRRPKVARAVVNFVGGWVGERCPSAEDINQDLFRRGNPFDRPTLWLYGYRDPLYGLPHSRKSFTAFRMAGGQGAFRDFVPPEGLSGHQIDASPELWTAALEDYLTERGLPAKPAPTSAQAIDGNTLKLGGAIYRLWGVDAPELDQRCYPEGWRAGIEAARTLAAMVERWPVTCVERSTDGHGRKVAVCRAAGRDIGAAMVLAGMAWASSGESSDYVELETRAMRARMGVHAHACLAPWEWRAQRQHSN